MRRTALKRKSRIKSRSAKTERLYEQRRPFVAQMLRDNPRCQIRWDAQCFGKSQGVHEYIARSQQGEIVPGPKADAQGQRFLASCHYCNGMVSEQTNEARARGLLK